MVRAVLRADRPRLDVESVESDSSAVRIHQQVATCTLRLPSGRPPSEVLARDSASVCYSAMHLDRCRLTAGELCLQSFDLFERRRIIRELVVFVHGQTYSASSRDIRRKPSKQAMELTDGSFDSLQ